MECIRISSAHYLVCALMAVWLVNVFGDGQGMAGVGRRGGLPQTCLRLRGGVTNKERWEAAGFSLKPDFGPEDHPEVPLDVKLGDASEFGDTEAVRKLLAAGANVHRTDPGGFTALHRAAFHGQYDTLCVLLEAGANPNAQDTYGGRTPLHQAAGQGYKQVVKRLLNAGADAKIKDYPYTPDVDKVPGMREAINSMPPVADGCGPDKVYRYPGLNAMEYAEEEGYDSVAEMLQPWTNEY